MEQWEIPKNAVLNPEFIKNRAQSNQELLRTDPIEYVRRLRLKAQELTDPLRSHFLDAARKIEIERGL